MLPHNVPPEEVRRYQLALVGDNVDALIKFVDMTLAQAIAHADSLVPTVTDLEGYWHIDVTDVATRQTVHLAVPDNASEPT